MISDDFYDDFLNRWHCAVYCFGRSMGNFITIFHKMISLHNPNLIAFVSNRQRLEVVICGCLPSELFLISRAVGGPVFQVPAHVFILLSSRRRKPFCSWWHLKVFQIANDTHNFSVTHSSIYSICIGVTHCAHCHCALLSLCCTIRFPLACLSSDINVNICLSPSLVLFVWQV